MGSASLTGQQLHKKEDKGKPSQDEITFGMQRSVFHMGLTIQHQRSLYSC